MKRAIFLLLPLLAACQNTTSILDPAPYRPKTDGSNYIIPTFSNLDGAATELEILSNKYFAQTDDTARQKLGFDALLLGIPVATAVNAAFHGSTTVTTALGLSSGTVNGINQYFSPGSKLTAYENAAISLSCASAFARGMSALVASRAAWIPPGLGWLTPAGGVSFSNLTHDIAEADTLLMFGIVRVGDADVKLTPTLTDDQKTLLMSQSTAAKKTYNDVSAAFATVDGTPAQLWSFANSVETATYSKVLSSGQNVTAALASLPNGSGSTPSTPGAPSSTGSAGINTHVLTLSLSKEDEEKKLQDDAAAELRKLTTRLPGLTNDGEAAATAINNYINVSPTFTKCSLPG